MREKGERPIREVKKCVSNGLVSVGASVKDELHDDQHRERKHRREQRIGLDGKLRGHPLTNEPKAQGDRCCSSLQEQRSPMDRSIRMLAERTVRSENTPAKRSRETCRRRGVCCAAIESRSWEASLAIRIPHYLRRKVEIVDPEPTTNCISRRYPFNAHDE